MKRKIPFGAALAMALLIAAVGLAVAAELGVFEQLQDRLLGEKMTLLNQVSQAYATQIDVPADQGFPALTFNLTQARFDGETLYAAYRLTPGPFKMEIREVPNLDDIVWDSSTHSGNEPSSDWSNMLSAADYARMQQTLHEKGEVFLTVYTQTLGDGVYLADGAYISPDEGDDRLGEAGDRIGYRRLRLAEKTARDTLEVSFPLLRARCDYYLNAEGEFLRVTRLEDRLLPVTLRKDAEAVEPAVYDATLFGHAARVKLWVSDIDIRVQVGLQLPEETMRQWQTQRRDGSGDAPESFALYADGAAMRPTAQWTVEDATYPLLMNLEFALPDAFTALTLVPRYLHSGEHPREALKLE